MNQEWQLSKLQGNWTCIDGDKPNILIDGAHAIIDDGIPIPLAWRPDLKLWVITGITISILKLTREDQLQLDTPKNGPFESSTFNYHLVK